jgi:hypothetical protein
MRKGYEEGVGLRTVATAGELLGSLSTVDTIESTKKNSEISRFFSVLALLF